MQTNASQQTFINSVAGWIAFIVILGLLFYIGKSGLEIWKGNSNSSFKDVLVKALGALVIIGLVYFIATSWTTFGSKTQNISSKALDIVNNGANELVGGGSGN